MTRVVEHVSEIDFWRLWGRMLINTGHIFKIFESPNNKLCRSADPALTCFVSEIYRNLKCQMCYAACLRCENVVNSLLGQSHCLTYCLDNVRHDQRLLWRDSREEGSFQTWEILFIKFETVLWKAHWKLLGTIKLACMKLAAPLRHSVGEHGEACEETANSCWQWWPYSPTNSSVYCTRLVQANTFPHCLRSCSLLYICWIKLHCWRVTLQYL
jgi:hypothetical protein